MVTPIRTTWPLAGVGDGAAVGVETAVGMVAAGTAEAVGMAAAGTAVVDTTNQLVQSINALSFKGVGVVVIAPAFALNFG